ncbi:MAG: pre-peptidase C-terminal domain-containing protein [Parvularculaceae bacterium]|nr:pre-peptidase C-terminal domain-containing protein [Parvularculaceae bacterium]
MQRNERPTLLAEREVRFDQAATVDILSVATATERAASGFAEESSFRPLGSETSSETAAPQGSFSDRLSAGAQIAKPAPGEIEVHPEAVGRMKGGSAIMAPSSVQGGPVANIGAVPSTILIDDVIEAPGDFDLFGINLVAGQTYLFSVYGSGAQPLPDTVLFLLDGSFNLLNLDDDGGHQFNSLLTYTATYTGLHIIDVEGFGSSTGQYTLDAVVYPGFDVVSDTGSTTYTIGQVRYGFIDAGPGTVYGPSFSEVDTYAIQVEAGKLYTIEVAGGADYASDWFDLPPGEIDPVIFVYDSNGNIVAVNDDISFPSDISSRVFFQATSTGTYYLDVFSYQPWSGGFTITSSEIDPADFNLTDSINWFDADNVPFDSNNTAYVYFALPGESFGELADNGVDPLPSFGWNDFEKQQIMLALQEYEKILGVNYEITTNAAEATFRLITTTSDFYGAYFYPQDPAFGSAQGIGVFNVDSGGWTFDQQQSLLQGGFSFAVMLHEFGHAHGLAHPHDTGGGSDIMLGVTGPFDSLGIYDLNQGVYTVMSYNDAWQLHPDGPSPFTADGIDNGWSGTLSAIDIATLQDRYGVAPAYATGNNTYLLKDANEVGTYYETIWDTGGNDTIRYNGARNARIDLLAATIDYSATGGGVISFVDDIWGGFTIARGVVIENATGGSGADVLLGNSAANVIIGNNGDDFLMGREGADTLIGGAGTDTASYATSAAGVNVTLSHSASGGDAQGDTLNGIENLEGSAFADNLHGDSASNTIDGGDGDDFITGGNQTDVLNGGDGNDRIEGGNQADVLNGDGGDDLLFGGNQADVLNGGAGNDRLDGGTQDDLLNGGSGDDWHFGGNGKDIFAFTDLGGLDTIADFVRGQDKADLSDLDAVDGGALNAFTWIGGAAFSGVAGQLRSYSSGGAFFFAGDTNGDGVADFRVQTNVLLAQSDFIFI